MVSPFRRHQQRVHGIASGTVMVPALGAPPEPAADTPEGQEYAALRVLLHDNLRQLADVQSVEARNPLKAEFAKAFAAWIEGVLAATDQDTASQDEILIQNMIWAIDYRDFDYALLLGAHALRHRLAMPERFNRTVACFLAEEIATISINTPDAVSHGHLVQTGMLVDGFDMPDQAKAKLMKAFGRSLARKAEDFDPAADNAPAGGKASYVAAALEALKRAFDLDKNIGVKKEIEKLGRQLEQLSRESTG